MTLLREVMDSPLDPGYAAATKRRQAGLDTPSTKGRKTVMLIVALLMGFAVTAAVVVLRAPRPAVLEARATLESEVRDRTNEVERMRTENAALTAEVEKLQNDAAGSSELDRTTLTNLGIAAGTTAVHGPGISIVLTDGEIDPNAQNTTDDDQRRVHDVDLQVITNSLWASGAEAISINGHRLTATSAIRSAGQAILVDFQPLVGPYTVEAIGKSSSLQSELAKSAGGRHIQTLKDTYGIGVDISAEDELSLAGSDINTLHYAQSMTHQAQQQTQDPEGTGEETP